MPFEVEIRKELRALLEGGNAHLTFEDAIRELPAELRGRRPQGLPYSPWELLEHIRITQHDILEFIRDPNYESPPWPEGYWPKTPAPAKDKDWNQSIKAFQVERQAILKLVGDPAIDLVEPFPHGSGQTLMREALLAADHTAYHLGQMIAVRRLLGNWPAE
jgi:hypothetical protein